MKAAAPSSTVVVCTRDRPVELERCLEAVAKLDSVGHDVLIVDNSSTDGRTPEIAARYGFRVLNEPLEGLSRARNVGARACRTEIVAYLDDDAIPEPGWLTNVVAEFDDPSVMAVTGKILPIEIDTEAERLFERLGGFGSHETRKVLDRTTPSWFEIACFGGMGSGGNMAVRRRAFDVWPGFDERLGAGTELPGYEE